MNTVEMGTAVGAVPHVFTHTTFADVHIHCNVVQITVFYIFEFS